MADPILYLTLVGQRITPIKPRSNRVVLFADPSLELKLRGPDGVIRSVGSGGNGTVTVGATTTGAPGTDASVTVAPNGSLLFTIPTGEDGSPGPSGAAGAPGAAGTINGTTITTFTGILKGDGANISVAVSGTDYLTPSGNGSSLTGLTSTQVGLANVDNTSDVNKPVSTVTQNALNLKLNSSLVSAFGLTLIDDADNTAARTTLGLGTLATQSGTFSGTSSGTNTGDQTSIVGITGTTAQFNTACTDADFSTGGGTATGTNTGDQTSIVGITGTIAQFNTACTDADFATGGGTATGTNTGDQTTVSGNAGSATVLQNPRTINGTSFDGSTNITVTAAAGTLTGTTLNSTVVDSSLTSLGTLANLTVTNPITGSVTGSAGSATGNAATATALQNARTINGVSFDGTANITISAAADAGALTGTTLAANVVNSSITSLGTLTGELILRAGGTTDAPVKFQSGTNLSSAEAGADEFDGTAFYRTVDTTNGRTQLAGTNIFRLAANLGTRGSAIADFFDASSAFPTVTNGIYELIWDIVFLKNTAGTVTWTITNTQNYTNITAGYRMNVITGLAATGAVNSAGIVGVTTAAAALPVTGSLSNATNHRAIIRALVECGTAGNIRLRITQSAGTVTPLRGSMFTARRLFAGNVGTFVA